MCKRTVDSRCLEDQKTELKIQISLKSGKQKKKFKLKR